MATVNEFDVVRLTVVRPLSSTEYYLRSGISNSVKVYMLTLDPMEAEPVKMVNNEPFLSERAVTFIGQLKEAVSMDINESLEVAIVKVTVSYSLEEVKLNLKQLGD